MAQLQLALIVILLGVGCVFGAQTTNSSTETGIEKLLPLPSPPQIPSVETKTAENKTTAPIFAEGGSSIVQAVNKASSTIAPIATTTEKQKIHRRPGVQQQNATQIVSPPAALNISDPTKSSHAPILPEVVASVVPNKTTELPPPEIPKKPVLTIPSEELAAKNTSSNTSVIQQQQQPNSQPPLPVAPKEVANISSSTTHFSVEEPNMQYSKEEKTPPHKRHNYFLPIVIIILTIPILIAVCIVGLRRFKEFWYTRHYRRMDFLIDEMYND